jgi:hypothetical protein
MCIFRSNSGFLFSKSAPFHHLHPAARQKNEKSQQPRRPLAEAGDHSACPFYLHGAEQMDGQVRCRMYAHISPTLMMDTLFTVRMNARGGKVFPKTGEQRDGQDFALQS